MIRNVKAANFVCCLCESIEIHRSANSFGIRVCKPTARDRATQWDSRNEAECPLIKVKAKNAKAN